MRRKFLNILLALLLFILVVFGLFWIWTWYQLHIGQSLQVGEAQPGTALGGLVIPQTAVLYGALAGFFLLITVVSIWVTYRVAMFAPENGVPENVASENSVPETPPADESDE